MDKDTTIEKSKGVPGSFTFEDLLILYDLVKKVPENGIVVEIGCYYGKSSSLIYYSKNNNTIFYSIDNFTGTTRDRSPDQYIKMIKNMSLYDFYPRLIFGDSNCAKYFFQDKSVDLLFVDADHDYSWVKKDIENFADKIKRGGIMAGHDWEVYESVRMAVKDFFGTNVKINNTGNIWWVQF